MHAQHVFSVWQQHFTTSKNFHAQNIWIFETNDKLKPCPHGQWNTICRGLWFDTGRGKRRKFLWIKYFSLYMWFIYRAFLGIHIPQGDNPSLIFCKDFEQWTDMIACCPATIVLRRIRLFWRAVLAKKICMFCLQHYEIFLRLLKINNSCLNKLDLSLIMMPRTFQVGVKL